MKFIPIILFAYARPDHLRRTLECLRDNQVPFIYAFSDGPRTPDKTSAVAEVRRILRAISWCEVVLCERDLNMGLGRSILAGVTEVFKKHDTAIVFEDDLVCMPGTYAYLCAALEHYQDDERVMSVTGWTHPLFTPGDITDQPYFDGRAECLVWGAWARTWRGMNADARTLMDECGRRGIDIRRYGADLPAMAKAEARRNIWAVRLLYWHILNKGLCLRPPWSMVEHIGADDDATNAKNESWLKNPPLRSCPPLPELWPNPLEHPECGRLYQKVYGRWSTLPKGAMRVFRRRAAEAISWVFGR